MRLIALLICLVAFVIAPAVAVAATPSGTLSTAEYQTLASEQKLLKPLGTKSSLEQLGAAQASCRGMPAAGSLLHAERSNCVAQIDALIAEANLTLRETGCAVHQTTSVRMGCLLPGYRGLHDAFKDLYTSMVTVSRATAGRGFSATCRLVLAGPPATVTSMKRLVGDISTLVTTLQARNPITFEKATGKFISDAADLQSADSKSQSSLALCPYPHG